MNVKYIVGLLILCSGCNKLVEVKSPSISTDQSNVYTSNNKAIAVLNDIYARMSGASLSQGSAINSFMALYAGLSADELTYFSGAHAAGQIAYYQNNLSITINPDPWFNTYNQLFTINLAIEGLHASTGPDVRVQQHLLGEALFLRALHYFYLVNLYGGVPLVLGTDYKVNLRMARSTAEQVYQQIVDDLKEAESRLTDDLFLATDRVGGGPERIYPSKWAVKALLARVYLYTKDYANAAVYASAVIDNHDLFELLPPGQVFLKNSREAIWQLQPIFTGLNTESGRFFVLPANGPNDDQFAYLSDDLLSSFEQGDQRRTEWVDSVKVSGVTYRYPYKYRSATFDDPVTEYEMMFRLAELYLIRAEAYVHTGHIGDGIEDLNKIRHRAGLPDYAGVEDIAPVSDAIYRERRVELFTEFGHRWLDLKRSGRVDSVMAKATVKKGGVWKPRSQYYPINQGEIKLAPNLTQTEGY